MSSNVIIGLMRGLTTLLKITISLLWSKTWLEDPRWAGSEQVCGMEYFFHSVLWFIDGDHLTGPLHVLYLQLSPPPPSSLAAVKSGMETIWYWLTWVFLENGS